MSDAAAPPPPPAAFYAPAAAVRSPSTPVRALLFLVSAASGVVLLTAGFPPGARDRLPVLLLSTALAVLTAIAPVRGIAAFCFLFPCVGLLARLCGGTDPVTWPGVLFAGLAAGWCFRFLYDFESEPASSRADAPLRTLLAIWVVSAVLAASRAVTLWAAVRRLTGRSVNGEMLPDAIALRETLFAFAALTGGVAFYFLLRRAGEAARHTALSACLAGTAVSAAVAILQRAGVLPSETRAYWKMTGRFGGGSVDPNSLGLLCALLLVVALTGLVRPGYSASRATEAEAEAEASGRSRAFFAMLLVLLSAGLVLSGSRSGLVLAALTIVALFFAKAFPRRVRVAALAALVLLGAAAGVAAFRSGAGSAGARILQTFDPALPLEYRVSARPVLWRAAGRLFLRHPVEGAGMGAFTWRFPDLMSEEKRSLGSRDNPGSGWIQALAETGAIGFLATAAAALALAAQGWGRSRATPNPRGEPPSSSDFAPAAAGIAVVVFLVSLAAGSHWLAPDVALLFFLLAASSALPARPGPRRFRWMGPAAVLVYAVAAAVAIEATADPEEAFRYSPQIGFHELEQGPGGAFRWTSPRFALWMRPGESMRLGLANFTPLGQPVTVEARAGARRLYRRTIAPGEAVTLRIAGGSAPSAILFALDRSFVPRRLGASSDPRRLGLLSTSSRDAVSGRP